MIEIYKRDENGKDRFIAFYTSYDEMFRHFYENDLKDFGYNVTDRTTHGITIAENDDFINYRETRYCYVAYENDKFVTPDRLVGLFRDNRWERRAYWRAYWNRRYNHGAKRTTYGGYRSPKTMNERRAFAANDDEFAPSIRGRRNARHLPNSWDDINCHAEKGWKHQSKRKNQWKIK